MKEFSGLTATHMLALIGFAAVARHLNFARAAQEVGCTPSVLSRRISTLEHRLGGSLFLRSTRRVALTSLGETLLMHWESLHSALHQLNAQLLSQQAEPAGNVRLHLPTTYGRRRVALLLGEFLRRYPDICLDVNFNDEFSDLIASRADLAVRIGQLSSSGLIATGLKPIRRFACASPDYLASAPALEHPEDLKHHRCLSFSPLKTGDLWVFGEGKSRISVRIQPVLRANNADALHQAALDHSGIALLSDFIAEEDIASGRLIEVLTKWPLPQPKVQLVWVDGADSNLCTRALINFLIEKLGR